MSMGSHWCNAGNTANPAHFPHHNRTAFMRSAAGVNVRLTTLRNSLKNAVRFPVSHHMGVNTYAMRFRFRKKVSCTKMDGSNCTSQTSHLMCTGMWCDSCALRDTACDSHKCQPGLKQHACLFSSQKDIVKCHLCMNIGILHFRKCLLGPFYTGVCFSRVKKSTCKLFNIKSYVTVHTVFCKVMHLWCSFLSASKGTFHCKAMELHQKKFAVWKSPETMGAHKHV